MKKLVLLLTSCTAMLAAPLALADEREPPSADPAAATSLEQCLTFCQYRWSALSGGLGAMFVDKCRGDCRAKWPATAALATSSASASATPMAAASNQRGETPPECMYRLTKSHPAAQRGNMRECGCNSDEFRRACNDAERRGRADSRR